MLNDVTKGSDTICSVSTSLATCPCEGSVDDLVALRERTLSFTPRLRYRVPAWCLDRLAIKVAYIVRPRTGTSAAISLARLGAQQEIYPTHWLDRRIHV